MRHLQLVFSDPGDDVSEEEYDAWYDAHLDEILAVPGFRAAQRYKLTPQVENPSVSIPTRRLTVYTTDREPEELKAAMAEAGMSDPEAYERLKERDAGALELPEWWRRVRFAAWDCIPIGERVEAT
jgi:hypothetical protein